MVSSPPMPSQRANDSATDISVGTQMSARCSSVGMPTITARTSLSRLVSLGPRRRAVVAAAGAGWVTAIASS
jgi:NADPH-dependent curcumin reductase CurA